MFIDSHCHLMDERYTQEAPALTPAEIVQQSLLAGVTHCIGIACERHEWAPNLAFAATSPRVSLAVGIHPYHAGEGGLITADELLHLAAQPKVVALGETGLDYSAHNNSPKAQQHASFHTHLQVAAQLGIPAVIHTRDAEADTLAILAEHPKAPFVLHCFTGSRAMAEDAVGKGGYISFSGILTFKKSHELREIAAHLPREKVLIETDAPYLAPEPFRSRRNTPALLPHTAETLAGVWQVSPTQVGQITTANTRRLFTRLTPA